MQRLMRLSRIREHREATFQSSLQAQQIFLRRWWIDKGIQTCSLFKDGRSLYFYAECTEPTYDLDWPEPLRDMLEPFPNLLNDWPATMSAQEKQKQLQGAMAPLEDIFHDSRPQSEHAWRDGHAAQQRIGSVARLRPDMYASYVFYHYQKQEEDPGSFNKYYMIGAYGTTLFSYHELPAVIDLSPPTGLLSTNQTPANWHEIMEPHFQPWEETDSSRRLWRTLEQIYCI